MNLRATLIGQNTAHRPRDLRRLTCFLPSAGLVLLLYVSVLAAVELIDFSATPDDNRILLEWETAIERETAGFFIRRNTSGGNDPDDYVRISVVEVGTGITRQFIPAQGNSQSGAIYAVYDPAIISGTVYFYFLEGVDDSGLSVFHGPAAAGIGAITPSPTSTITLTPNRTRTTTPTRTPTRTITPIPSRTPSPTLSPTTTFGPSETPTNTPTFTPLPVSEIDLTLTAIMETITPFPTHTPTRTPRVRPSRTPTTTPTATPDPGAGLFEGADPDVLGRFRWFILGFLGSGLILTGVILYYFRQGESETEQNSEQI